MRGREVSIASFEKFVAKRLQNLSRSMTTRASVPVPISLVIHRPTKFDDHDHDWFGEACRERCIRPEAAGRLRFARLRSLC
jgi:hypothetical protein